MEGQTVITVTSPNSGGDTPAMACFMGISSTGRVLESAQRKGMYQSGQKSASGTK